MLTLHSVFIIVFITGNVLYIFKLGNANLLTVIFEKYFEYIRTFIFHDDFNNLLAYHFYRVPREPRIPDLSFPTNTDETNYRNLTSEHTHASK